MPVESDDACVSDDPKKRAHPASDEALGAAIAERDRLRAQLCAQTRDTNAEIEDRLGGWWTWSVAAQDGTVSAGLRERLGWADAIAGDDGWDDTNRDRVRALVRDWLAGDDTQPLEASVVLAHRDGHDVRCCLRALVSQRDSDGQPITVLGANIDLAHAFRAEEAAMARLEAQTRELEALNNALEKQAEQLQRSNLALEDFAYAASHDLQTPLRAIAHFATWIDEDLPADSGHEVREHVVRLLDRVERLGQLHRDLLAYARVNHTKVGWVNEDVPALVRSAWNRCRRDGFELIVEGQLEQVRVPQMQLRAIIEEMLCNAVRHHDRPEGRVHVRLQRVAAGLRVEVEDDGPGIEPRYADQAFKVLETLRPRDAGAGSGMGLPIAQRHARRVGAELTLARRPGRGALFVVTCPVEAP